jgi:hypothetical protein
MLLQAEIPTSPDREFGQIEHLIHRRKSMFYRKHID